MMEEASEQLKHLPLVDVIETGPIVGAGAYGQVVGVRFNGLKCAGKKLQGIVYGQTSPDHHPLRLSRFVEECVM